MYEQGVSLDRIRTLTMHTSDESLLAYIDVR
jgi:hypothetical protein